MATPDRRDLSCTPFIIKAAREMMEERIENIVLRNKSIDSLVEWVTLCIVAVTGF